MFIKIIILIIMVAILIMLACGLIFLIIDKGQSSRTVKALSWRIVLSLMLFIFLLVSYSLGWIEPHGL